MSKYRGFTSTDKMTEHFNDDIKHAGHDYTQDLMQRGVSRYLLLNPHINFFITNYLNPFLCTLLERVRYIRNYYNFGVPKDYDKIN